MARSTLGFLLVKLQRDPERWVRIPQRMLLIPEHWAEVAVADH